MKDHTIQTTSRMAFKVPLWTKLLLLVFGTFFILCLLYLSSLSTALTVGFRDGCFKDGPECALPLIAILEPVLIPSTCLLLFLSFWSILQKKSWGFKLFTVCLIFSLFQAFAPGSIVLPMIQEFMHPLFTPKMPTSSYGLPPSSTERRAALASTSLEYKDEKRKFSLFYPSGWDVTVEHLSEKTNNFDEEFEGNEYLHFAPKEKTLSGPYKILYGFDVRIFDQKRLEEFLLKYRNVYKGYTNIIGGFAGFEFNSLLEDAIDKQHIHTEVVLIGHGVLVIRCDANDVRAFQPYFETIENLP